MKKLFLTLFLSTLLSTLWSPATAQETVDDDGGQPSPYQQIESVASFVIEDIRVEGLKRFDPGVVFNRLQVSPGDTFNAAAAVDIIDALYKTGYFREVDVLRDGDILVVQIRENPTIAEVSFSGADEFSEDALLQLLTAGGIVKARVFDRAAVNSAALAIEQAYIEKNFYQAKVNTVISPLPRNRLAILFEVDEGAVAAIRNIDIVGNDFFSDWTLRRLMTLEPRSVFNFFTDNYRYSGGRLSADIERIRTLYYEAGYLRFELLGQQVEVSADQKHIDIIIRVAEGDAYAVSRAVFDGEFSVDEKELTPFINQFEGDIYSGQISEETVREVKNYFADLGYASAAVSFETKIDDDKKEVEVVYTVNEGRVQFIRRIDIVGNSDTRDEVIRRELLIFEKERYSRRKINISQNRLRRLGYFSGVRFETVAVPESPDEVDLAIHITESGTGKFNIGVGFSTDGGVTFEASLDTPNVFGSGNDFKIVTEWGDDSRGVELALDQFYHTDEGVSRHIELFYREDESSDDSAAYSLDDYGLKYGYGVPFTEEGKYFIFLAFEQVNINSSSGGIITAPGVTVSVGVTTTVNVTVRDIYNDFRNQHGDQLDVLKLELALNHDTRDTSLAPTEGHRIAISGEAGLPVLDLKYYFLNYAHDYYWTLKKFPTKPVLHLFGGVDYGDSYGGDEYPFYERFLLGGTQTLRGFEANSIGFANDTSGNAIGGRFRLYATTELAVEAKLFESQQIYVVPFVDAGIIGEDIGDADKPRVSAGLEFRWVSPIGPLSFSYVKPLKEEPGDDTQDLQFSISSF